MLPARAAIRTAKTGPNSLAALSREVALCYSTNFSPGWNGVKLEVNPPGGRHDLYLHEVQLLTPEGWPPKATKLDAGEGK